DWLNSVYRTMSCETTFGVERLAAVTVSTIGDENGGLRSHMSNIDARRCAGLRHTRIAGHPFDARQIERARPDGFLVLQVARHQLPDRRARIGGSIRHRRP